MSDLAARVEAAGLAFEPLRRGDARRHFAAWCEAFCGPVKLRTGKYRLRRFHWHAFSFALVEALNHQEAFEQYSSMPPGPVLAIPESWSAGPGVRITVAVLPDLTFLRTDIYVFPESMEWTMAFTHEQPWLGPYFAWRPMGQPIGSPTVSRG